MNFQPFINAVAQAGVWCMAAFILGKSYLDYINKDKEHDRLERLDDRDYNRAEREKLYQLMNDQASILKDQKILLSRQVDVSEHNKDMLDKLTNIQMLHTNRLDSIEDRQSRMEEELKRLNSNCNQ